MFKADVADRLAVIQAPTTELRMMRYEIGDYEWGVIRPMLPNKPRGIPRVDDRRILNGIFWGLEGAGRWALRGRSGLIKSQRPRTTPSASSMSLEPCFTATGSCFCEYTSVRPRGCRTAARSRRRNPRRAVRGWVFRG